MTKKSYLNCRYKYYACIYYETLNKINIDFNEGYYSEQAPVKYVYYLFILVFTNIINRVFHNC